MDMPPAGQISPKTLVPMDMPPAGHKFRKNIGLHWTCLRREKSLKKTRPWIYYGLIVRYRPLRQKLHPRYGSLPNRSSYMGACARLGLRAPETARAWDCLLPLGLHPTTRVSPNY